MVVLGITIHHAASPVFDIQQRAGNADPSVKGRRPQVGQPFTSVGTVELGGPRQLVTNVHIYKIWRSDNESS
jgi:hypothetical protein